jgi:CubicO group peptidase (beta-lactamase class C family)
VFTAFLLCDFLFTTPCTHMKQTFRSLSILVLALCFWNIASSPASAQTLYDFTALDRLLQDSVAKISGTGGGYTLVLIKDGREIYNKTFTQPGKMYSADRPVPIASASKWLSAGVVMGMVDAGTWKLDDSAGKFLSYAIGDKARMTVRQMFSMTSGIAEDGNSVEDDILRNSAITMDSAVRAILALPLATQPGGSMAYGGRGMQVTGRCAEVASKLNLPTGEAWDTLFARYVSRPLGMRFTFFTNANNPGVAGSAVSSANEYKLYLQMLLNGGVWNGKRILSESIINEMKRDQTRGAPILYSPYAALAPFVPGVDKNTRYALGHWREVVDAATGDVLESSSQGAFGFSPWIDWRRNLVGVFSVQSQLRTVEPTYLRMKQIIRETLDRVTSVQASYSEPNITIAPNPASNFISVQGIEGAYILTLTNTLGQVVMMQRVEESPTTIDIFSLPTGLYFLRAQSQRRFIFTHPVYIQR